MHKFFFAVVGRRSSVISLVRHRDRPVKKIKFSPFFKYKLSFQKFKIFRQYECTRCFRRRRSSPSSVVGHLPLSSQGRTCEKNQIFAFFQKQAIFPKFKIFSRNECTSFFRLRRSSPLSVIRHFPLSSQVRTCEKKSNFRLFFKNKQSFQNSRLLGKMSAGDFFAVVGCRRRQSSVISLFRHRDGPVKKIKFSPFFKNKQSFQNSRFLGKMSAQDFFAVAGRRRLRSSVISLVRHRDGPVKKIKFSPFFKNKLSFQNSRFLGKMSAQDFFCRLRSLPSSVVRHFHRSSQGRTCPKNVIFAVFQIQAIFPKFKIFGQNECTRFFRRRRSSQSSVVRHFPLSSQGRTCEKKYRIFAVFQKQAIFPKFKIIRQNECTSFFLLRRSSPSSVFRHFPRSSQGRTCEKNQIFACFSNTSNFSKNSRFLGNMSVQDVSAVVGRRRRRSSVIYLFRHRDGPVKKIKFSPFFKNRQSFQNSRFLVEMSARVFFGFVGRRRCRSSVISLFRHRYGPVKKIKFSPFFKNKQSFQNSRFLGKMSAGDFFAVVGCRRRQSSVISLFRHRDGPVKKIKFSQFFKNKQSFQNSRFLGKMSARHFFAVVGRRHRRSSVIYLFRHRDGPVKKIRFSPFFKNKQSFQNSRFLGKMSARDFFAVVSCPSFPSFITGTDL